STYMEKQTSPDSAKRQISWPHLLLGLAGVAVSAYAIHVHNIVVAGGHSACGVSATINCDAVIGSKYGVLLGLPLGVWGMAYFALMMLTSVTDPTTPPRIAVLMRAMVAAAGFLMVLGLAYISYIIIKVTCPVCMTIHVIITIVFLYSLFELWQMSRKSASSGGS
ncbi:MAG: vitamin K epoxide reductase family protein, partial [Abditibacteriaceae bacterium]